MKTWKTIKMMMLAAGRTMDMIYTKRSKRSRRSRWNIKAWAAASKERSKYIGAIVHHRNIDIVRKGPYTTSIHQKVNKRILLFSQQNEKCVSFDTKFCDKSTWIVIIPRILCRFLNTFFKQWLESTESTFSYPLVNVPEEKIVHSLQIYWYLIISGRIFGDCTLLSFTFDIYIWGLVEHSYMHENDLQ